MDANADVLVSSVFLSFGRKMVLCLLIYMAGYMRLSVVWLIFFSVYAAIQEVWQNEKDIKFAISKSLAKFNEKDIILGMKDVPSWVFFPDMERVEWINQIIHQVWPTFSAYARNLVKEAIEPIIHSSLADYKLKGFHFREINFGTTAPRIGGLKVHEKNVSRHEIIMDLDFIYVGNCEINFSVIGIPGGIQNFQVRGLVRVIMKPLIPFIPFIGGLQIFFLDSPSIDYSLIGAADLLDLPGVSEIFQRIIMDYISKEMVLPNKLSFLLSEQLPSKTFQIRDPKGLLQVNVVEAQNLMKKDVGILGKGKSDPFVILTVGLQEFRTPVVSNSVDPKWDFWCEFVVDVPGQQMIVTLKDHDTLKKNEMLGSATIEIDEVAQAGNVNTWIVLDNAHHGLVHMRMMWWTLSSSPNDLAAALLANSTSALLIIFIDSIKFHTTLNDKATITITVNQLSKKIDSHATDTSIIEQSLTFPVHNPLVDQMYVQVTTPKTLIGEFQYKIRKLLNKPGMTEREQSYQLYKCESETRICFSMKLSILKRGESREIEDSQLQDNFQRSVELTNSKPSLIGTLSNGSQEHLKDKLSSGEEMECDSFFKTLESQKIDNHSLGRILIGFKYHGIDHKFEITIHRVINIPLFLLNDSPYLFTKVYLLPERTKESKRRTEIVKDECNPTFNQSFNYKISLAELLLRQVEASVCTKKGIFPSQTSCIGMAIVNLNELNLQEGTEKWFELMSK